MFENISFEYPEVFLIFLLFVISSLYFKPKTPTYYMPHLNILKTIDSKMNILLIVLKWFVILFSIIALSSPIKILETKFVKNDGIDIVLSLDTSGSMQERGFNKNDLQQNRWQVVSSIVQDFIKKRVDDNIGLVVFGTSVLTASPLSFDKEAQSEVINYLDIGIVGRSTALLDSLAYSVNMLKESKAKSKIIIILTDGDDMSSKIPLKVIVSLAKKNKIIIYAIGIGESNQFLLKEITSSTNGKMFIAKSKTDLKNIYKTIDNLEKSKIKKNKVILKEYLFFYPLFFAIIVFIGLIFLKNKE